MRKRLLSLALALVLCLGLTVPAFAVGTVKVVEDKTQGLKITLNGFLREETHSYIHDYYYDEAAGEMREMVPVEHTIYVVADNSTVTIEALAGRKYADAGSLGLDWEGVITADSSAQETWERVFLDNRESYAYKWETLDVWVWSIESKCFISDYNFTWPLDNAVTETVSPKDISEDPWIVLSTGYGIDWLCESDYAKLVPVDGQTTTPAQPENPDLSGTPVSAAPTNDKLTVNGTPAGPTVYKIDGNNYFKIRDVAALLNGTEKQFAVGYDNAAKSATATTGQPYEKQPGDLAGAPTTGSQTATPSNDAISVDGQKIDAQAYKIGGSNYFKLRDLGKALNFFVGWSREQGMFIDTTKPYSE